MTNEGTTEPAGTATALKKRGRQGEGGGRPPRLGEKTRINLDLSGRAGELLRAEAERTGSPLWSVLDGLVLEHLGGVATTAPAPNVVDGWAVALEIALIFAWHLEPDVTVRNLLQRKGYPMPDPEVWEAATQRVRLIRMGS